MFQKAANRNNEPGRSKAGRGRIAARVASFLVLFAAALPVSAQDPKLLKFFRESAELTPEQIAAIQGGQVATYEFWCNS